MDTSQSLHISSILSSWDGSVRILNGPATGPGDKGLTCGLSRTGLLCRTRKNSGSRDLVHASLWFGSVQPLIRDICFSGPAWAKGTDEPALSLSFEKLALSES